MTIIDKLSFAVAAGVVSGGILSSAANWALAPRDATEIQLADAVRSLAEQSRTLARSLEETSTPAVRLSKLSDRSNHDRAQEASAARDVEQRLRSIAAYSAQIERSLQGIDKAMSTVPLIQKRRDRVKAVVDP